MLPFSIIRAGKAMMFTAKEIKPEYKLLQQVNSSPRPHTIYTNPLTQGMFNNVLAKLKRTKDVVALDFETTGLDPLTNEVVGVGLSNSSFTCYIDTTIQDSDLLQVFMSKVADLPLIAHNVMFDGRWFHHYTNKQVNWVADTYGMFKHLASEGFPNQSWGLKDAQISLLGWDSKGDVELDKNLIEKGILKKPIPKHLLEKLTK